MSAANTSPKPTSQLPVNTPATTPTPIPTMASADPTSLRPFDLWVPRFTSPSSGVAVFVPTKPEAASRIGRPQLGQAVALSEISFPQSLHSIKAIQDLPNLISIISERTITVRDRARLQGADHEQQFLQWYAFARESADRRKAFLRRFRSVLLQNHRKDGLPLHLSAKTTRWSSTKRDTTGHVATPKQRYPGGVQENHAAGPETPR
jgi:hypothetical protein